MSLDILCMGDCTIDVFMLIGTDGVEADKDPDHPKICFYHGSKIIVHDMSSSIAGNAPNVGMGTKKLGLKTGVYSHIGDDNRAKRILKELNDAEIDTKLIKMDEDSVNNMSCIVVFGGERTIFSYHNKRKYIFPKFGPRSKPKMIYYTSMGEGFRPFQKELIHFIRDNEDVMLAFNPGGLQLKNKLRDIENVLSVTDILFLNKEESEMLVGERENLEQLHLNLQKLGPKLTVITNGTRGSSAHDGSELIKVGIYSDKKPTKDRTGAGDAFSSGFLSAIHYKKSLKDAMYWGMINSGNAVKEIGATHGLTSKSKMDKTIREVKKNE